MKKALIVLSCIFVFAGLAIWMPDADAYETWSSSADRTTGNCATCHGGFNKGTPYFSAKDNASWSGSLHDVHFNLIMLGGDNTDYCTWCHNSTVNPDNPNPDYSVDLSSSGDSPDGHAISCSGCHGRLADANSLGSAGTGWGAGLRQHHYKKDPTTCISCHSDSNPAAFTTKGEDTMPAWYDMFGLLLDPCNKTGRKENFAGSATGLDNDGDNAYDAADSDCSAVCIDKDGDHYGNPGRPSCSWGPETDCNDNDNSIYPGAGEYCDNKDNDCNAATPDGADEGGGTCPTGLPGVCSAGTTTCSNGALVCQQNIQLSAEVCDGKDNDCDGTIDEDLARPTTCGAGACAGNTGTETCSAGNWGNDTCNPFAGAATEICGNGVDENCDGQDDACTYQLIGDMNEDDIIDISDVILVLRMALKLDPIKPCSNINNDSIVDISDVILTLRMALKLDPLQQCN